MNKNFFQKKLMKFQQTNKLKHLSIKLSNKLYFNNILKKMEENLNVRATYSTSRTNNKDARAERICNEAKTELTHVLEKIGIEISKDAKSSKTRW